MRTIISWNVNGIRAVQRKGLLDWLQATGPDILCVQETKARPEQLDADLLAPPGYQALWASAERKGYSGVGAFVKEEPLELDVLGVAEFDCEGRTMILSYPDFTLINAYFPNSQAEGARLDYKIAFCEAIQDKCNSLVGAGKNVILSGDYNIAHRPIDLKNPRGNESNPGYLPEERAWMDRFTAAGYVDTFRMFCSEPGHYTWWTYRFNARARNIGWRIDCHCVNEGFRTRISGAGILKDVMGSDHCPIVLRVG